MQHAMTRQRKDPAGAAHLLPLLLSLSFSSPSSFSYSWRKKPRALQIAVSDAVADNKEQRAIKVPVLLLLSRSGLDHPFRGTSDSHIERTEGEQIGGLLFSFRRERISSRLKARRRA